MIRLSLILCIATVARAALPLCDLYQDRFGQWIDTATLRDPATYKEVIEHFMFGGPLEATEFTRMWIPNNCAVHRFTGKSIHTIVNHIVAKSDSHKPFHITVVSDSGLRGILCGAMRILSGSELTGPLQSQICGHNGRPVAISLDQLNVQHYEFEQFGKNITFSFTYVQSLTNPQTIAHMKNVIAQKPNVLLLNTVAHYRSAPTRKGL